MGDQSGKLRSAVWEKMAVARERSARMAGRSGAGDADSGGTAGVFGTAAASPATTDPATAAPRPSLADVRQRGIFDLEGRYRAAATALNQQHEEKLAAFADIECGLKDVDLLDEEIDVTEEVRAQLRAEVEREYARKQPFAVPPNLSQRRRRHPVAVLAASVVAALGPLWVWFTVTGQRSGGWLFVVGAASAGATAYLVANPARPQALERRLSRLRPDAVLLYRGDGYVSIGPAGIDLWSVDPLRLVRSIRWSKVSAWDVGRLGPHGDFESSADPFPDVKLSEHPAAMRACGDFESSADPFPDAVQAHASASPPPALRLKLTNGRRGELVIEPIAGRSPKQAAAQIERLAEQTARGRRLAAAAEHRPTEPEPEPEPEPALGSSAPAQPTGKGACPPGQAIAGPATGSRQAAPRRERLPLAQRAFWPTAGVVRWFGCGAGFAVCVIASEFADKGYEGWAVGLGGLVPLLVGAAIGAFRHLRANSRKGLWWGLLRLVVAVVLVALGTASAAEITLQLVPTDLLGMRPMLDFRPRAASEPYDPLSTEPVRSQYQDAQSVHIPNTLAVGTEPLDSAADPFEWVGRTLPRADPVAAEPFFAAFEAALAVAESNHDGAGERLQSLSSCRIAGFATVAAEQSCGALYFVDGGDVYYQNTHPSAEGYPQIPSEWFARVSQPDQFFSQDALDRDVIASLTALTAALDPDAPRATVTVRAKLWQERPAIVYTLDCFTAADYYSVDVNHFGTVIRVYRSPV
jgi:hypothetical protein